MIDSPSLTGAVPVAPGAHPGSAEPGHTRLPTYAEIFRPPSADRPGHPDRLLAADVPDGRPDHRPARGPAHQHCSEQGADDPAADRPAAPERSGPAALLRLARALRHWRP